MGRVNVEDQKSISFTVYDLAESKFGKEMKFSIKVKKNLESI